MAIQRQLHQQTAEKKLNVTKQPCHARGVQRVPLLLSQTRQKMPLED